MPWLSATILVHVSFSMASVLSAPHDSKTQNISFMILLFFFNEMAIQQMGFHFNKNIRSRSLITESRGKCQSKLIQSLQGNGGIFPGDFPIVI